MIRRLEGSKSRLNLVEFIPRGLPRGSSSWRTTNSAKALLPRRYAPDASSAARKAKALLGIA
jgi:hypothetical protein